MSVEVNLVSQQMELPDPDIRQLPKPQMISPDIITLDKQTFKEYLNQKDAALVMFYDPLDPKCTWSKDHFIKAAENGKKAKQSFMAVDCSQDSELCASENVDFVPFFKLYTKGRAACHVREHETFPTDAMTKIMEYAEVISKPRRPRDYHEKSYPEALWSILENVPREYLTRRTREVWM